jgi:TonB family protein
MFRKSIIFACLFFAVNLVAQTPQGAPEAATQSSTATPAASIHLTRVVPVMFPAEPLKQKLGGAVLLTILFNEKGTVEKIDLLQGDPQLADAARASIRLWEIEPYSPKGIPEKVGLRYRVDFQPKIDGDICPSGDMSLPSRVVITGAVAYRRIVKHILPDFPDSLREQVIRRSVALAYTVDPTAGSKTSHR